MEFDTSRLRPRSQGVSQDCSPFTMHMNPLGGEGVDKMQSPTVQGWGGA